VGGLLWVKGMMTMSRIVFWCDVVIIPRLLIGYDTHEEALNGNVFDDLIYVCGYRVKNAIALFIPPYNSTPSLTIPNLHLVAVSHHRNQ
jgi:hypothetical protein